MTDIWMDCYICQKETEVESIKFDRHDTAEHKTIKLYCKVCKQMSNFG